MSELPGRLTALGLCHVADNLDDLVALAQKRRLGARELLEHRPRRERSRSSKSRAPHDAKPHRAIQAHRRLRLELADAHRSPPPRSRRPARLFRRPSQRRSGRASGLGQNHDCPKYRQSGRRRRPLRPFPHRRSNAPRPRRTRVRAQSRPRSVPILDRDGLPRATTSSSGRFLAVPRYTSSGPGRRRPNAAPMRSAVRKDDRSGGSPSRSPCASARRHAAALPRPAEAPRQVRGGPPDIYLPAGIATLPGVLRVLAQRREGRRERLKFLELVLQPRESARSGGFRGELKHLLDARSLLEDRGELRGDLVALGRRVPMSATHQRGLGELLPRHLQERFGHGLPVPNWLQRAFWDSQGRLFPEDWRSREIDTVGIQLTAEIYDPDAGETWFFMWRRGEARGTRAS